MPLSRRLGALTFLLISFPVWSAAQAACYYPSGRQSPSDIPCRNDTPNAPCCGQGYICLSNGLCQATAEELKKPGVNEYARGSCTDKTWQSSGCPLYCIGAGIDFLEGGNGVLKCANTTEDVYICIDRLAGTESSCEERRNVLSFAGTPSAITTIGVLPSTTSSSISTTILTLTTTSALPSTSEAASPAVQSTPIPSSGSEGPSGFPAPAPTNTASTQSTSSSNIGPIVGGAVGGTVALIIAGMCGWCLAGKRTNNLDNSSESAAPSFTDHQSQWGSKQALNDTQRYTEPREVPGTWKSQMQQDSYEVPPATPRRARAGKVPAWSR